MKLTNEKDHEYRFGDNGPKYLGRGDYTDFGVVIIKAGDGYDTHMHERQEEAFFALEGKCDVYVNGEKLTMVQGDYLQCEPGDAHTFQNPYDENFKACFIKAPYSKEKDSVYIDWKPGEPFDKTKVTDAPYKTDKK